MKGEQLWLGEKNLAIKGNMVGEMPPWLGWAQCVLRTVSQEMTSFLSYMLPICLFQGLSPGWLVLKWTD